MSKLLWKHADFIRLLLNTESQQAKALLKTITDDQTQAVSEILYNISKIATKPSDKAIIRKRSSFLRKLMNKKTRLRSKVKLVSKHNLGLLKTLTF